MRGISVAEPHFHKVCTECYIVIAGFGLVIVGHTETKVATGDVIIIPPRTGHYTIVDRELVFGVVNTPSFTSDDYFHLSKTRESVGFNSEQYKRLAAFD